MSYCLPSTLAISQIPHSTRSPSVSFFPKAYAREVYFNHDLSTTKKLQAGVGLVTDLLGVTLGPKGRNVVLENKYGPPKIVNDGETILKEVISAGMNPIQIVRGIEKTSKALVSELRLMSREIEEDEIADVAAVSAGNDYTVGNMIADALRMVGKQGFIRIETGRCTENRLEVVEGMQFERGYLSPYFVTDRSSMSVEFGDCKILLVDKKISNPKEILGILDEAMKGSYPLLVIAEGIEEDALAPIIRNKLTGSLKVAAIKAPAFGERKSDYLDDIAILTGGTVIRDDVGLTLEKAGVEVLGSAVKVVITKNSTLLVTDGSTQSLVEKRIAELRSLVENTEEKFDKKIVNERIARLSDGIAIIQVGAQTVVELKDKKLRVEDALNATRAAIEEGVVVGGGCCLLRLSKKVDSIKELLDNDEQKVGADIFKKALSYPSKLIAKNAGMNGNVVVEKILSSNDVRYGYNAAKNCYEDLMAVGILDPSKVVRCCLEHAASVAKTFLTADVVVVDAMENMPVLVRTPMRTSNFIPASRAIKF